VCSSDLTFAYVFLITNLFQPYRLVIIFLAMGALLNLLVMLVAALGGLDAAWQMGLHVLFSTFVLVCVGGLLVMPITKVYQQFFIHKPPAK
jgi:hypothetical protein